jgi:putative zinc finger/helix-turn-helix YgiT family protein
MLCPGCDKEITATATTERNTYTVKGENVEIDERLSVCPECGVKWSQEGFDFAAEAYRVYRSLHRMLQPEEIKAFRKSQGLTQEELASLLGWSEATINRYEKGALQERSHDNALRMFMTCDGLRSLLEVSGDTLSDKKRARLLAECTPSLSFDLMDVVSVEQNEYTGFCLFSSAKFKAVIGMLTFDTEGVWKTSLNKLLWYSDFLHFRVQGVGITGLTYVRLPYGPVPNEYKLLVAFLSDKEFVVEPVDFGNGYEGERIRALDTPDRSLFVNSELTVLEAVRDRLAKLGAGEISKLSHRESAWKETPANTSISYRFANELKFVL